MEKPHSERSKASSSMQYCHGRKKEHVYCACIMNQYVKQSSMYRHKHQHEILHWHTQYVIICWCNALGYVQRLLAQPSMWQLVETLIILLLPSLLPQVQLQYLMIVCVCGGGGGGLAHTQTTMIIAKAIYYNTTNSTFLQWSGKVVNGW